ncbi:PHP domain-containing protein, partial [Streptomyces sp. SID7760]|nr:PHP domain-containing protein [Streptomyces sp. SID7760]
MPGFTHLHTVSGFSMRYGGSHPERLAERAADRGMDALALTDRDTLAGAVRFAKACEKAGIRPLFGVDLAVSPATGQAGPAGPAVPGGFAGPGGSGGFGGSGVSGGSGGSGEASYRRRTPVVGGAFVDESAPRVTFLARDGAAGWAELCRMVTAAHAAAGGGPPVLPRTELRGEGVYVLLGPGSEVGRALAAGRPDRAARLLAPWREVYGDSLRLEAVDHGRTGTGPGSLRLAARTVGFAAEQGVPAVLTNAVRYADPGQGPVADVLDAARRLVPVDPRRLDGGERWLKDPGAMAEAADRICRAAGLGP